MILLSCRNIGIIQKLMINQDYPQCPNKKEGHLVCLHPNCDQYPFFCTGCESQVCEAKHFHGDRLNSISFKEFIRRVLKERKPSEELQTAINKYIECLNQLKQNIEEFIVQQNKQIQEIRRKAAEIDEEDNKIITKLRKKQYDSILGKDLDGLWASISKLADKEKQKQTIEFLTLKQQQIIEISANFKTVNSMELNPTNEKKDKGKDEVEVEKQEKEKKREDIDDVKVNDVDDRCD